MKEQEVFEMMFGMDWGAGPLFGPLFMVLLWTLVISGTIWLAVAVRGQGLRARTPAHGSALAILEERFARDEIGAEEFSARKAAIGGAPLNAHRTAGSIALVSASGLLVLALVAAVAAPRWTGTAGPLGNRIGGIGGSGMAMMGNGGATMMGGGMPGAMGSGSAGHMAMANVSSEFDYLANMIPHHEEAVASARLLLAGTERAEMEAFAQSVIDVQTSELAQMREWLATWYPGRDTTVAYEPMMRDLSGLSGDALDRAFLEDMVPHHMAAVMMSQQLVSRRLAQHPVVVPFAERIRDTQHAEIFQMATWLRDRFGVSPMGRM